MCGIFSLFLTTKTFSYDEVKQMFMKIQHRGPDSSSLLNLDDKSFVGFHRLSINDLSSSGNQPFVSDDIYVTCNGEIYNYKSLCEKYDIQLESNSDCEIILHLYKKFGIEKTLRQLHGVFALSVYDKNINKKYIACDRIGVRPIYYQIDQDLNFAFCSEAKSLVDLNLSQTQLLRAGHYMEVSENTYGFTSYFEFNPVDYLMTEEHVIYELRTKLEKSIELRLLSDRPIAALLSGGLDSSIVSAVLADIYKKRGERIHTFTIGFEESTDVKNARKVAEHINSIHHEHIITPEYALSRIPEVIEMIETYDITTIRASTMMYIICEYISKNFDFKVIFSGEGADELLGGYLYFHYAPNDKEFEEEALRITKDLQYFDVLRADRCTASHGLELRVPFLDQDFMKFCHTIPGILRKPIHNIEKYYLRSCFEDMLPYDIVWRKKEALSDGISGLEKSWFEYIQEWVREYFSHNFTSEQFTSLQNIAATCNNESNASFKPEVSKS